MALWTNSCWAQGIHKTLDNPHGWTWTKYLTPQPQLAPKQNNTLHPCPVVNQIFIPIATSPLTPVGTALYPVKKHSMKNTVYIIFSFKHMLTLKTPKSRHLKQVYTRDCFIKGMFDDQSKATSVCCFSNSLFVVKPVIWHLHTEVAPCACLCFPNQSRTGNQTPAFRGKQPPFFHFPQLGAV